MAVTQLRYTQLVRQSRSAVAQAQLLGVKMPEVGAFASAGDVLEQAGARYEQLADNLRGLSAVASRRALTDAFVFLRNLAKRRHLPAFSSIDAVGKGVPSTLAKVAESQVARVAQRLINMVEGVSDSDPSWKAEIRRCKQELQAFVRDADARQQVRVAVAAARAELARCKAEWSTHRARLRLSLGLYDLSHETHVAEQILPPPRRVKRKRIEPVSPATPVAPGG